MTNGCGSRLTESHQQLDSDDQQQQQHQQKYQQNVTKSNGNGRLTSGGKRNVPKSQRPLTRYLPIMSSHLDLRQHVESAGHQITICPHVIVDSFSCRGYVCLYDLSKADFFLLSYFLLFVAIYTNSVLLFMVGHVDGLYWIDRNVH